MKKWADTSELRTSTLQSATSQVDLNQYLNLFPVLKLPLGYELLLLDFDQLYPGKEFFFFFHINSYPCRDIDNVWEGKIDV